MDGTPTGVFADPQLVSPGTGGILGSGYKLPTLTQYDVQPGSAIIDASVALAPAIKGYTPALYDFFGRPLANVTAPDIGAAEFV